MNFNLHEHWAKVGTKLKVAILASAAFVAATSAVFGNLKTIVDTVSAYLAFNSPAREIDKFYDAIKKTDDREQRLKLAHAFINRHFSKKDVLNIRSEFYDVSIEKADRLFMLKIFYDANVSSNSAGATIVFDDLEKQGDGCHFQIRVSVCDLPIFATEVLSEIRRGRNKNEYIVGKYQSASDASNGWENIAPVKDGVKYGNLKYPSYQIAADTKDFPGFRIFSADYIEFRTNSDVDFSTGSPVITISAVAFAWNVYPESAGAAPVKAAKLTPMRFSWTGHGYDQFEGPVLIAIPVLKDRIDSPVLLNQTLLTQLYGAFLVGAKDLVSPEITQPPPPK